jgi:hypothetical protein
MRRKPAFPYVVAARDAIAVVSQDGPSRLALVDLDEVEVLTTDDGPFADDVFWVLRAAGETLVVPWSATGADRVLSVLQTLEGFDNEAVIEASATAERAVFPVWKRVVRTH